MANVRYTKGGTAATLGTKTIDENGVYNASDDSLDGYSQVTVEVPEPDGSITLSYDTNGTYSEDIKDYAYADVTVNVPVPEVHTQSKTVTATTSQQIVTPNPGFVLDQVTVNPQQHTDTFTPSSNVAANDMGPINNYRYVNTAGMILPTGTKEVSYDSNGSYTESVSNYENIEIDIDVPVSGTLGTKNIITNGTYTALDDDVDGYSEVNVNVPQNATLGIKSITANGNYTAITDGYDGYSRVDVNVSGAALQSSKTVTATTSQQTVIPDVGYDGLEQVIVDPQVHTQTYTPADNTAANDMGVNNNYRYVDTSGMYSPTSITPSNNIPPVLVSGSAVLPTANGLAISSMDSVTPSSTPTSVSNGDIVKIGGSGVIVDSVPTPTNISPSNSDPVWLANNNIYKTNNTGYAIGSYYNVSPSDSSPGSVSVGDMVRILNYNGYVYRNSQPQMGLVPSRVETITNMANNATQSFAVSQKPRYITFFFTYYAATRGGMFLILDTTTNKAYRFGYWGSSFHNEDYSSGYTSYITSVSATSVTVKNSWGGAGNVVVGFYN